MDLNLQDYEKNIFPKNFTKWYPLVNLADLQENLTPLFYWHKMFAYQRHIWEAIAFRGKAKCVFPGGAQSLWPI